jgi:hypothetical protein
LWIHSDSSRHDGDLYYRLIATDPLTLRDLFVAEQRWINPYVGADQQVGFPLINRFIDWLKHAPTT